MTRGVFAGDRACVVVVQTEVVEPEIVPFDLFEVVAHYVVAEQSFVVAFLIFVVADIATFVAAGLWAALLSGEHSCPVDPCSAGDLGY